jgi:hypothetical protein
MPQLPKFAAQHKRNSEKLAGGVGFSVIAQGSAGV